MRQSPASSKAGWRCKKILIQADAAIIKAGNATGVITAQNDRTNRIVNGFIAPELGLEPFATAGASHVDFQQDDGKLYLDVQVTAI